MYLEPPLVVPTADTRCLGAVVVSVRCEADLRFEPRRFDEELVRHDLPRLDTRGRLRWRMAITPRGWRTVELLLLLFRGRPADLSDGLELAGSANWSHGETALDLRRRADGQTARRGSGDRAAEPVIAGRPSRCRGADCYRPCHTRTARRMRQSVPPQHRARPCRHRRVSHPTSELTLATTPQRRRTPMHHEPTLGPGQCPSTLVARRGERHKLRPALLQSSVQDTLGAEAAGDRQPPVGR